MKEEKKRKGANSTETRGSRGIYIGLPKEKFSAEILGCPIYSNILHPNRFWISDDLIFKKEKKI